MSPSLRPAVFSPVLIFAICGVVSPLGAAVPIPNPSFEQGNQDQVEGWTLSGGQGGVIRPGSQGQRAISVTGDKSASNGWLSESLPLTPNIVYRLQFSARRLDGTTGLATTGPLFCNRDLSSLGDGWTRFESYFVTPQQCVTDRCRLRFGQWELSGQIAYDDIRVDKVLPIYREAEGIALGEGEVIHGDQYSFQAPFNQQSANHARPLLRQQCTFNTHRWVFGRTDQEVVYRHAVGPQQLTATIKAQIGWYRHGRLVISVSSNGQQWHKLGTLDGTASQQFDVPSSMLPATAIWVKLTAERAPDDPAAPALQVFGYGYTAQLADTSLDLDGATQFIAIDQEDPQLEVTMERVGSLIPGTDNRVVLGLRNRTDRPLRLRAAAVVNAQQSDDDQRREVQDLLDTAEQAGVQAILLPPEDDDEEEAQTVELDYTGLDAGRHQLRIIIAGDAEYRAETTVVVPALHASGYGGILPSSSPAVGLWECGSGWKVSARRGLPQAKSDALAIDLAANEAEAAQLVVRPSRPLAQFQMHVSDLRNEDGDLIESSQVDILRVRYVRVTQPTDSSSTTGLWPDPLPPCDQPIELAADRNHPFWIRVRTARGTPAGQYRGRIHLSGTSYQATVPLQVTVFGFELPDRMSCQTAFGFSPATVWRYHGLDNIEQKRDVLDKYLTCLADHHISPYDPAPLDPIRLSWENGFIQGGSVESSDRPVPQPVFDFDAWDAAMTKAIEHYGFNTFRLGVQGLGGGTFHQRHEPSLQGFSEDTKQYQQAMKSYLGQLEAHLDQQGWLEEAFVYWFDEPDPKDYEFVLNGFSKLKRWAPKLRRMLTEQVEPGLIGGPNIWCPLTPAFDLELAQQRRQEGEEFWWYVCTGPKAPYCTLFIDHPATEMRVWLWQTWKRKIRGILVWQTNYWTSSAAYPDPDHPQNPYADPMGWVSGYSTEKGTRRPWGNGDGRFLYPPESAADGRPDRPVLEGPVSSIRLEMLRDGIEDYEYLVILERLLDRESTHLATCDRDRYQALLQVPDDISKDLTHFTQDPGPMIQHRRAVARAIEHLSSAP